MSEPARSSGRARRIDYHLLNDGSDDEAAAEDRIPKRPRMENQQQEAPRTEEDARSEEDKETTEDQLGEGEAGNPGDEKSKKSPSNLKLWEQFELIPLKRQFWKPPRASEPVEDRLAKCKRCSSFSVKDSVRKTSTSGLMYHLKAKHHIPGLTDSGKPETDGKQPSISTLFHAQTTASISKAFEEKLLEWIVHDHVPFSIVESPAFVSMIKSSGMSIPFKSHNTIARRIIANFDVQRENLRLDLHETCQTISLSLDAWSSQNGKPILAIIGHWITPEFSYREKVLEFTEIEGSHTGENMAYIVDGVLDELNLKRKLLAITSDNASSNLTMVSELYYCLEENLDDALHDDTPKLTRYEGTGSHIRCTAHVLNLIVGAILSHLKAGTSGDDLEACMGPDSAEEIKRQSPLARIRVMAVWISRSPQRKQEWKFICNANGLRDNFIEYDVETRWNSTYRMLRDALAAKPQIKKWIESHRELFPRFSDNDWAFMQQLAQVLGHFEELTLTVSKRQQQVSMLVPIYYELHDLLHDMVDRHGEFQALGSDLVAAARAGLQKFETYYEEMDGQDICYMALILDPRFKTSLLEKELGSDQAREITHHLKEVLERQYPPPSPVSIESQTEEAAQPRPRSLTARALRKVQPDQQSSSDIERYLRDGLVLAADDSSDDKNWLLKWWGNHSQEYPCLAAAARDYLAVPASGVSVERLFSSVRDMLGIRRNSLSGESMRRLVLLRDAQAEKGE